MQIFKVVKCVLFIFRTSLMNYSDDTCGWGDLHRDVMLSRLGTTRS